MLFLLTEQCALNCLNVELLVFATEKIGITVAAKTISQYHRSIMWKLLGSRVPLYIMKEPQDKNVALHNDRCIISKTRLNSFIQSQYRRNTAIYHCYLIYLLNTLYYTIFLLEEIIFSGSAAFTTLTNISIQIKLKLFVNFKA